MNKRLASLLSLEELQVATNSMAKGKAPGPDGVVAEFYTFFWDLIGIDHFLMIEVVVKDGGFLDGVNRGLITLLFKAKNKENLSNWQLITLLNVSYKILRRFFK
jgi:hypothetical protein